MRNLRASTTFRTSSGTSFGMTASTMTKRSPVRHEEAFPLPLILNFVPGFVFAGTFSVIFFPESVSSGISVPRRKSKNGTERVTVTSSDSGSLFVSPRNSEEPKGEAQANPAPPQNKSEKSNVWRDPRDEPAEENPRNRSSNPDAPENPLPEPNPPGSAEPKAS